MAANRWRRWTPTPGKGTAPHRPTPRTSIVAALLAVGVVLGFVVVRTGTPSSSRVTGAPPGSSPFTPSTTAPPAAVTVPTSTPPTTAVPVQSTAPPTTTAAEACTRGDVSVTTEVSADASGTAAQLVTRLTDVRACVFTPTPVPPFSCAATLTVEDASTGQRVWPGSSGEVCQQFSAQVLEPGSVETLRATWSQPPAGHYRAVGTWAWSGGAAATEDSASSAAFDVT